MGGQDQVAGALRAVVADFGPGLRTQPERLRALLNDVLGSQAGSCRSEIDAVVTAAGPAGRVPVAPWVSAAWAEALPPATGERAADDVPPETILPAPPTPREPQHVPPVSETVLPARERETPVGETVIPALLPHTAGAPLPEREASPGPVRSRRVVLLTAGLVAAVLLGAAIILPRLGGGDGDGGLALSQVGSEGPAEQVSDSEDATEDEGPDAASTDSSSPAAAVVPSPPTDCPAAQPDRDAQAEVDIRSGVVLSGVVATPEQKGALAEAGATGSAALNDLVSVTPSGPAPEAIDILRAVVPTMVESMADGRAVASGSRVCVIGSYIDDIARDQLEAKVAELRSQDADLQLIVEQHPVDHGLHTVILQAAINQALGDQQIPFASGSADLLPGADPIFERVGSVMQRFADFPDLVVTVEGHTDDVGSHEANVALSQARASSVRDALVSRGIPEQRLAAVGHGPDQPLASNTTEEGRQQNRRVVFNVGADHSGGVQADGTAPPDAHGDHGDH